MKINLFLRAIVFSFFGVLLFSVFADAQTQQWVARYSWPYNQNDEADFIYVDAKAYSYVGGTAFDTVGGAGQHMAVIKYDSLGTQVWLAEDTSDFAGAYCMAVDDSGEVFLTGYANYNPSLSSFIVVKFSSSGVFQWSKRLAAAGGIGDQGQVLTTDANYLYVAGAVYPSPPPYRNYRTVKLDKATGTTQAGWPQDYNGTGNNDDIPTAIAVDASGNVFVTGYSLNGSGDRDYLTIGYTGSGATLPGWPARWDGPMNSDDVPAQLILSGSNVIITGICNQGTFYDSTGDICTIMYDYSGNIVTGWPQIYNGAGNSWDGVGRSPVLSSFKPMAVDNIGNIYVGGWSRNDSENYDMIIFKYDPAGNPYPGFPVTYDNGGRNDILRGLVLDASYDICVTGWTSTALGNDSGNMITIEYDNAGNLMPGWPVIYNGPAGKDDQAMAIAAVRNSLWIAGYSNGVGTFGDFTTIKYGNSNPSVSVKSAPAAENDAVVYPNPSSGRFIIDHARAGGELTVTNVMGEIIYKRKVTSAQARVDLGNEAKGIYFYKIMGDGNAVQQGKLVVL